MLYLGAGEHVAEGFAVGEGAKGLEIELTVILFLSRYCRRCRGKGGYLSRGHQRDGNHRGGHAIVEGAEKRCDCPRLHRIRVRPGHRRCGRSWIATMRSHRAVHHVRGVIRRCSEVTVVVFSQIISSQISCEDKSLGPRVSQSLWTLTTD